MTGHIFSRVIQGIWEQDQHRLRSWERGWVHIPWLCQLVWVITAAQDLRVTIYHLGISNISQLMLMTQKKDILNKICLRDKEIFEPCSVTYSVMESRLGSDIMGWVESHICTRVPFHPWQRLNSVTLQYKGRHKFGKAFRSALSRPDHSSYFLTLCRCNTQHTRAAHSQARHNIISSMPSNTSGAIRQTFTQGVVYGDVMAIGKWLSSPVLSHGITIGI